MYWEVYSPNLTDDFQSIQAKNQSYPNVNSVYSEMVYCGPDQGRSEVETAGVAALRRGFQPSENAELGRKMPFMDGHYLKTTPT